MRIKLINKNLYHGTRHEWEDMRPKIEAIGTGEGNQSFGWGLYFTELKAIAKTYSEQRDILIDGENFSLKKNEVSQYIINACERSSYNLKQTINTLNEYLQYAPNSKTIIEAVRILTNARKMSLSPGYIYTITINKSNLKFLPWDNTISSILLRKTKNNTDIEQIKNLCNTALVSMQGIKVNTSSKYAIPSVLKIIRNTGNAELELVMAIENDGDIYKDIIKIDPELLKREDWGEVIAMDVFGTLSNTKPMEGGTFYLELTNILGGDPREASLFLLKNGVDGIKYRAGSIDSFERSENKYNYVIFDPSIVSVVRKDKIK